MRTFILRRLLYLIPVLFLVSLVTFLLLRAAPGDLASTIAGPYASEEQVDELRARLGMDKPVLYDWSNHPPPWDEDFWDTQYWDWMRGIFQGDLGYSHYGGKSVVASIADRLPITIELLILTLIFTIIIGIPIGIISAVFQNSLADYAVRFTSVLGLSIPGFWLATMVILIPSILWKYAPPQIYVPFFEDPWDNLRQFVPPALVLAFGSAAVVMRLARSSLLEVLRNDYIRTARAKGLRERVVIARHALKNALIPVLTVLSLQLATLLGGAIIVEQVFNLQGVGFLTLEAIFRRDYALVQAITMYTAVTIVLVNLAVDVSYAWIDPRIRYS
jgi:peptide/nickel transport system permease protein